MTMNQMRRYRQNLLGKIRCRAAAPRTSTTVDLLMRETLRYARSEAVRICAVAHVVGGELPSNVLEQIARTVDPLHPCTTDITWQSIPNSTGGSRKICKLPLSVAVGQVIALDLLHNLHRPREHIYDWPGRGCHSYVKAAAGAIRAQGPFALIADVMACHASVNPQALYDIEFLPTELIQNCLDSRQLRFRGPRRIATLE